ncbi:MAG TPA: CNNM domain-containing protein [Gemmatimonadaceae bacterium]|nr:CNNM domain-containing protein [Gemmatimonadaceae bacterium]
MALLACLTAAATAVRSVSRIWLRHWAEQRLRGANSADLFLERPQRLLLAAATGVAVTVYVAGALIGAVGEVSLAVIARRLAIFAVVVLVIGQLVPRAVARRWPTAVLPVLLPILRGVEIVLGPFVAVARKVTSWLTPRSTAPVDDDHDDLEDLLREGELEGVGERTEMAIISGVVQFGTKTLGQIMTPRSEVFAIDEHVRGPELALRIAQSRYSRVPIYRESLDNVIGMIHAFDVLKDTSGEDVRLRAVADAPMTAHCNDFLFEMLRGRRHLAVVRDGDGKLAGIVTLENLLEELVGDIRDEHDEPGASSDPRLTRRASGGEESPGRAP